ncbi:hypothetical protein [Bradyrhizobium sp. USDA 4454]
MLAARLDGHWLILDSRRSELIDDGELGNFTPMFAINEHGVQLFAAPYAKRLPLGDEFDAAPAAANAAEAEWTGVEPLEAADPAPGLPARADVATRAKTNPVENSTGFADLVRADQ